MFVLVKFLLKTTKVSRRGSGVGGEEAVPSQGTHPVIGSVLL